MLKTVLSNVGVDISKFTAHSIRAASSPNAKVMGASVYEIMGWGNWSNSAALQNFIKSLSFQS